ncbi:MAG: hypothetical protein WCI66_06625 [Gammaproteobacteria bacterium]
MLAFVGRNLPCTGQGGDPNLAHLRAPSSETVLQLRLREILDVDSRLVLFMTAKVQQKEIDEYLAIGAFGVIIKPFDPMTLARQIQEHWKNFQQSRSG